MRARGGRPSPRFRPWAPRAPPYGAPAEAALSDPSGVRPAPFRARRGYRISRVTTPRRGTPMCLEGAPSKRRFVFRRAARVRASLGCGVLPAGGALRPTNQSSAEDYPARPPTSPQHRGFRPPLVNPGAERGNSRRAARRRTSAKRKLCVVIALPRPTACARAAGRPRVSISAEHASAFRSSCGDAEPTRKTAFLNGDFPLRKGRRHFYCVWIPRSPMPRAPHADRLFRSEADQMGNAGGDLSEIPGAAGSYPVTAFGGGRSWSGFGRSRRAA